ncbi:hypothetical protein LEP1GSC036_0782 [Leptospira weilii str. 2006001853]|uniref:Uncharacterized protein n=1 Tax=Leptospira weilii str. 2006001853 TaxID=1001589 RepID=A0A828Z6E7_9LEPT|nr:hypothetical protein LEP1GSC036_0782 [Leptospira weilii str. 2006001853]EMN46728.1 hypothetical protein LEP1GSC086_4061 [Leptospira weilii str. LNT 1234]QDK23740.1 hypothetical protein FHG67_14165 [Leptospira weilii]QDK26624.1 hypothetical protein FHG68_08095 [Leptospira weilii]
MMIRLSKFKTLKNSKKPLSEYLPIYTIRRIFSFFSDCKKQDPSQIRNRSMNRIKSVSSRIFSF